MQNARHKNNDASSHHTGGRSKIDAVDDTSQTQRSLWESWDLSNSKLASVKKIVEHYDA